MAWQLTLVVVCLLVVVTAGSYLLWRAHQPGPPKWCAGVGLSGPTAATARGALDGYLGHASAGTWRQDGDTFINTTYTNDGTHGYESIQVGHSDVHNHELAPGQWEVQGACV